MRKFLPLLILICIYSFNSFVQGQETYTYATTTLNYVDISGTGTLVADIANSDDALSSEIALGSSIDFFGTTYSSFKVCSNGWITLEATETSTDYSNSGIPNADGPIAMIAPYWDDLEISASSSVYYEDQGDHMIIMFDNVPRLGTSYYNNFQIKLFYSTGIIEFHYDAMDFTGDSPTVGVENASETVGVEVHYNGAGETLTAYTAYRFEPAIFAPDIDPTDAVTYNNPITVSVTTNSVGADTYYTTDGIDPTEASTLYSSSFQLEDNTTVKAKSFNSPYESAITVANYTFEVSDPAITPTDASNYYNTITVEITCASTEADIYYTIDGSDPTTSSTLYTGTFDLSGTTTVKAKAFWGILESNVITRNYSFYVEDPVISPTDAIDYDSPVTVEITCASSDADIYYTLDGTDPTTSSILYEGTFELNDYTTVKAKAFWNSMESNITTSEFDIYVADPVLSPNDDVPYYTSFEVTITCATVGAEIYYTLDGTDPTESSTLYEGPFDLTSSATIKAKAFNNGVVSNVVAKNYQVFTSINSGDVWGTWYKANSPYMIQGNISIPNGYTLTIEPGVEVYFNGEYYLDVNGQILAEGTEEDNILFTAYNTTNGWEHIDFNSVSTSNDSSKFVNCIFEYGKVSGDGGAIYIAYYHKVLIDSSIFRYNYASSEGGAIYLYYSNPPITNSYFVENECWNGGAIYGYHSQSIVEGNTFDGNTGGYGGAVYANRCDFKFNSNILKNNNANERGGGFYSIYYHSGNDRYNFNNNLFYNNYGYRGGAIYWFRPYNYKYMTNNTIVNNEAYQGGGVYMYYYYDYVVNNIIHGNSATNSGDQIYMVLNNYHPDFLYNNIEGGIDEFGGNSFAGTYENNKNSDPQFTDPLNENFNLQSTSSMINYGHPNPSQFYVPDYDLANNPRIYEGSYQRIDIGAYEYQGNPDPTYEAELITEDIDFGYLTLNSLFKDEVTLRNVGHATVTISSVVAPSGFLVKRIDDENYVSTITNLTVDPYEEVTFNVAFNPSEVREYTEILTINTNDTDNPVFELNLAGEGTTVFVPEEEITVDVTWCEDSIYISRVITILNGVTVTICEGTVVKFEEGGRIDVQGRLLAQGTNDNNILFTVITPGTYWEGIHFDNTSTGNEASVFDYSVFEYAQASDGNTSGESEYDYGGAIYLRYFTKLYFNNSIFRYNIAERRGGAIYNYRGKIYIDDCEFYENITNNNTRYTGGGAIAARGDMVIENSVFYNNHGTWHGGAIQIDDSNADVEIYYSKIFSNTAYQGGGGIGSYYGRSLILSNNAIYDNTAQNAKGGGVHCGNRFYNNAYFYNNTIVDNYAKREGGGIFNQNSYFYLRSNIIANNDDEGGYPDVYSNDVLVSQGYNFIGNIGSQLYTKGLADQVGDDIEALDPMLNPNLTLQEGSTCIDAGSPDIDGIGLESYDLAGNARVFDGVNDRIDIGAYEYQGSYIENRLPYLLFIGDQLLETNSSLELTVEYDELNASDNSLVSITSNTTNLQVVKESGNESGVGYELIPATDWKGVAEITVTVTDGTNEIESQNQETYRVIVGDIETLCGTIGSDYTVESEILKINCNVTVNNGVTLTIPEGTFIQFQGKYQILVYGTVLSEGTSDEPIYYTVKKENIQNGWNGFYFNYTNASNDTSKFKHCVFEYGKRNTGGTFYVRYFDKIKVDSSLFRYGNAQSSSGVFYLDHSDIDITNNTFLDNISRYQGGIMYAYYSEVTFDNNYVENAISIQSQGGAIYSQYASGGSISGNTFKKCRSNRSDGGAINMYRSDHEFKNNTFIDNTAYYSGGAARIYDSDFDMINCVFINNSASNSNGGALYIDHGTGNMYNCTFVGNKALYYGSMYHYNNFDYIYNSIFRDAETTYNRDIYSYNCDFYNCNLEGKSGNINGGSNNYYYILDIDPQFTDADNNDFSLVASSPMINTGVLSLDGLNIPDYDIAGNDRYVGDYIDMGAFEYQGTPDFYNINFNVEEDMTLQNEQPNRILNDMNVDYSFTLTIPEGSTVYFGGHSRLDVEGRILAIGTEENPITFTTDDPDSYVQNTATGWGGIIFDGPSADNDTSKFIYTNFYYGNKYNGYTYSQGGMFYISNFSKIIVDNCSFENNYSYNQGGAIYVYIGNPVIRNSSFINNNAVGQGGALYLSSFDEIVENNYFESNVASNNGGAIYIYNAYNYIRNNSFVNNTSTNYGGGIYSNNLYADVYGNYFENNLASDNGGGLYTINSSFDLYNNHFHDNTSNGNGGGFFTQTSTNDLYQNIFSENYSSMNGGGIYSASSTVDIHNSNFIENDAEYAGAFYEASGIQGIYNSIFRGNTSNMNSYQAYAPNLNSLSNNNIEGGDASFESFSGTSYKNFDFDPGFNDAENGDFSLTKSSSCINTGTPDISGFSLPLEDFAYGDRVYDDEQDIIDIGAFEYQGEADYYNLNQDVYADLNIVTNNDVRFFNDIYVDYLTTLTFPQDVDIVAMDHFKITVDGRVLAQGTAQDPITFKAYNSQNLDTDENAGWQGFIFDNTSADNDTSRFEYCNFYHGNKTNSDDYEEGGMFFISNFDEVVIDNSNFDMNYAYSDGGAVALMSGNARINNSSFSNSNSNTSGGAMYIYNSDIELMNNNFSSNNAQHGGGVFFSFVNAEMENSSFSSNNAEEYGGGLYADNSYFNLTGSVFSGNMSGLNGGGAAIYSGNPVLESIEFTNNESENGGGLYLSSVTTNVNASTFSSNTAENGGGIYLTSYYQSLTNNIIDHNVANKGGAIYSQNSSFDILNNTICDNTSNLFGGGMYLDVSSDPFILNSIFFNNTSSNSGDEIYINDNNSDPQFYYSNVEGNYEAFEGPGSGVNYNDAIYYTDNLDIDPNFSSAKASAYELDPSSYLIDAGVLDTTGYGIPTVDIIDSARIYNNTRIDIGAFELQADPDNRLPMLTKVGNQITETAVTLMLTCEFTDSDIADTHTIDITSSSPTDVSVSYAGNTSGTTYDLIPAPGFKGEVEITVTIDDGSTETSNENTETFTLLVGDVIDLCGTIATDSTLSAEIVTVSCNVIIPDGVTLTVPAGTYVEFQDNYYWQINGRLIAEGTSTDSIIFSVPSSMIATGWGGIRIDVDSSTNSPSSIDYCHFEYAMTGGNGGAIQIMNSEDITISNSYFKKNYAVRGAGIYLYDADVEISDNTFYKNETTNDGGAISSYDSTTFVISNNVFDNNLSNTGGAIYIWDSKFQTPTISSNTFYKNKANANGGAIYLSKSDPLIRQNIFSYNSAVSNGAVLATDDTCYIEFENNSAYENVSSNYGGVLYFNDSDSLDVENNIFYNNYAVNYAGAVYSNLTDVNYVNNLMYNNKSAWGGVFFLVQSNFNIVNNTIVNNESYNYGGVLYNDNSYPNFINTIMYNNKATNGNEIYIASGSPNVYYSDVEGGSAAFGGFFFGDYINNIDVMPFFMDESANNYNLRLGSSCINRGSPNDTISSWGIPVSVLDLNGNSRIFNNYRIDIGAYEFQNNPPTNITMSSTSVDENSAVGSTIGTFTTTDQDVGDSFTYTIDTNYLNHDRFAISGNTLSTNDIFDYETEKSVSVRIITNDGNGGLFGKSFIIHIADLNDNAPVVEDKDITVQEDITLGSTIHQVLFTDADDNNMPFVFDITNGNQDGNFEINSSTGLITLASALNYEQTSAYALSVSVYDGNFTSFATVKITVTDYNEAAPEISDGSATIAESAAIGDTVLVMTAIDSDATTALIYSILHGNVSGSFDIGSNGEIMVNHKLDFEANNSYELTVAVTDGINQSTAIASITVTDVNDNVPVVDGGFAEVHEYAPIGTEIFTVTAYDDDAESSLTFTLESGNEEGKFNFNTSTGLIALADTLDYSITEFYNLVISVSDGTFSSEDNVVIYVVDSVEIDTTGTGVTELPWNNLSIYPNPAVNELNINITNYEFNELTFIVRNVLGDEIIRKELFDINGNVKSIVYVDALESGIYFIDFIDDDVISTVRFIKE